MTEWTDAEWAELAAEGDKKLAEQIIKEELRQAALEIAKDDPNLFADYAGFERVMWSDDLHMKCHGWNYDDRDRYEQLVRAVYRDLT